MATSLDVWNPLREMQELSNRMNQLFGQPHLGGNGGEILTRPAAWSPSVNVSERDGEYHVTAELPGIERKDVHVTMQEGVLTITGERRQRKEEKGERFHRVESYFGTFVRSFTMPNDADASQVSAKLENGILDVRVAKLPAKKVAKAQEIQIG